MFKAMALGVLPPLIHLFLRVIAWSIRWTEVNHQPARDLWQRGQNMIIAFWHNRMLMAPFFYRGRGLKILISLHADGELISRVMRRFGFGSIRGSTTRGGSSAFRKLLREAKRGMDIAITPDGPRGPKYTVQKGIIELARITGLPIVPVTYSTKHRYLCPSWDALVVPRPFTKGVFIWGEPVWVEDKGDEDRREKARVELESRMLKMVEAADTFFQLKEKGRR
jgi:hypothetical protein